MTSPDPGSWPLSAATTAVLREPRTDPATVLRLAMRELVARDVVRVARVQRRRFGQTARVWLEPGPVGSAGLPMPLPDLARALLPRLEPGGSDAAKAVRAAIGWRDDLPGRMRTACRSTLRDRGLLEPSKERMLGVVPVTRWRHTPSGRAWAQSVAALTATSAVLPAVGLLLALDTETARALRGQLTTGTFVDGDLDALDSVLGDVGDALDGATDSGSGSSDGGDGGGGD